MKKCYPHRRRWHLNRARNQARRRSLRRGFASTKSTSEEMFPVSLYHNGRLRTAYVKNLPSQAPEILDLEKNYEETARFLTSIRRSALAKFGPNIPQKSRNFRRTVDKITPQLDSYCDFSSIKRISIEVALIIASEYDRAGRVGLWVPGAVDIHTWNKDVRDLLNAVGFLELAGVDIDKGSFLIGGSWKVLRFKSGDVADGSQIASLFAEIGLPEVVSDPELYDAILESLVNTVHHAYKDPKLLTQPVVPRWWMTAFVNVEQKRLKVITFDQGASIPGTLPNWNKFALFRKHFYKLFGQNPSSNDSSRDGEAISLAMSVGKTSTGQSYRGQGLPSMERIIERCVEGKLGIYSRRGSYVRWKGERRQHATHDEEIGGTLVTWDLGLRGAA